MAAASREFQVMVKPIGAICNLGCDYCYYLDKQRLYPDTAAPRMPDDLLEAYIVQHIAAAPRPLINFQWHGGEPTLLGPPTACWGPTSASTSPPRHARSSPPGGWAGSRRSWGSTTSGRSWRS